MAYAFTDDVIAAVVAHMNGDHVDDQLAIVRAHGRPTAASATLVTIGADGLAFDVQEAGGDRAVAERVTVPWPVPIEERADIRRAVVLLMPRPQH
ncbi:DUF2470 domain-containing protein [Agrococcus sp. ARC_14]|uniref:DUF2470 domain-containing protein n=1 Tax=Agrococcus sp. ARC_14 TaxID=2919927 RepID=UPI001F061E69|nr:DUF2470 domain-containing protein [Agrococcus sp. ARC_14]MCH1881642.1 DUF2470 domain-containing protein [Agrococcus sp. ARC_14]